MDQNIISSVASMSSSPRKTKVIKRYGNRKLYDTEQSSYVVLNDIAKMIRNEEEVRVIDNETKDDITSATLTPNYFWRGKKVFLFRPSGCFKIHYKKRGWQFFQFSGGNGLIQSSNNR